MQNIKKHFSFEYFLILRNRTLDGQPTRPLLLLLLLTTSRRTGCTTVLSTTVLRPSRLDLVLAVGTASGSTGSRGIRLHLLFRSRPRTRGAAI